MDEKVFEQLFRKYFSVLNEYAFFYTSDSKQAEDIVQDIFLKIWESRDHLQITTSIKSYLFRSVHNNCIQYLRRQSVKSKYSYIQQARYKESLIISQLFFESGLTNLFKEEIESLKDQAINILPDKTRQVYMLSRNGYLKNARIAEILNITEKAVEYHITRALGQIRTQLNDYLPILIILFFNSLL